ncbi:MAG: hypothetical protein EA392_07800 [Cryomorphaceae bacterium]|nr:MAG: hypothetical protein EA392_07800 [Cryomorphaceae bacterium]
MKTVCQLIPAGFLALGIALSSCESEPQAKTYDYEKADSLAVDYERELRTIRKDIKDAGNLYLVMREIGVPFQSDLVGAASKYQGATGRKKQALSLGAAGADLNYLTMFEQADQTPSYVKAILSLADQLGISSAFDEGLMAKITEVGDTTLTFRKKSSLLNDAYRQAEDNLYSEERAQITCQIVAGGWLQSMHIAANIGANIESQREVDTEVWNMIFGAEKVLKMLDVFENDPDCKAVAEDIRSLDPILTKLSQERIQNVHQHFAALAAATGNVRSKWF